MSAVNIVMICYQDLLMLKKCYPRKTTVNVELSTEQDDSDITELITRPPTPPSPSTSFDEPEKFICTLALQKA